MTTARTQRGAATLAITLLLLFAMMVVAGIANRNLIFEQRASANQARTTQAFEAAEAGLEWAQAMLASDASISTDCAPEAAPGNASLRERLLAYDPDSGRFLPRTWSDAGHEVALQAACVRDESSGTGWACSCPRDGHPALDLPSVTGSHPVFSIRFVAAAREGMVQLIATGCDRAAADCLPGWAGEAPGVAVARVQATLALLPALAAVPAAALTAQGEIDAGGAIALSNTDPLASGLTAHAGGRITLAHAALQTRPGEPAELSLAEHDSALAGIEPERTPGRLFGVDAARFQQLPGMHTLVCPADCSALIADALAAGHRRIRVAGDLSLAGPALIGAPDRPVLLVVEGSLRIVDGVRIHGAVVQLNPQWDTSGTHDARIDGALFAAGDVVGDGTPTIEYDRAALARLHREAGVFVRVPGSWRDF
jgi:hypothetical protein